MSDMRKTLAAVLAATAWWLISCRDLPAPEGGIFSISPLQLPSPGLVAGDTMRDSTGVAAPLRVVAFGVSGDTVATATPTFVTLDTGAHLAGGALLIGDHAGTKVRVVGSLGMLQTKPETVKVTLSPDTIVIPDSAVHHISYLLVGGDTVVNSANLTAKVAHRGSLSGVEAVIVRYSIYQAPPGRPGKGPTLILMNGTTPSNRDTTDGGGIAARTARLRLAATTGAPPDTAIVLATATYRGREITQVTFVLVFNSK